ncbi:hypothetical protein B0T21DRAFT_346141 [Apiosordaria backusii]|uniref:Uncharacterized protein n=1 Tax=Apiosordaria backusii TaxID=314023 RepID=A0AA40EN07_9PEZI|nr:hypothetical protein B0T21DRAFT_346141 [Apiosordaria backusii]
MRWVRVDEGEGGQRIGGWDFGWRSVGCVVASLQRVVPRLGSPRSFLAAFDRPALIQQVVLNGTPTRARPRRVVQRTSGNGGTTRVVVLEAFSSYHGEHKARFSSRLCVLEAKLSRVSSASFVESGTGTQFFFCPIGSVISLFARVSQPESAGWASCRAARPAGET